MNMPGFGGGLALSAGTLGRHELGLMPKAPTGHAGVSPQQFTSGLTYTCYPPCTWSPPEVQSCCLRICLPWRCFQTCYTRMAPPCPR